MTDRLRVTPTGFQAFIFVIGFILTGLGFLLQLQLIYCYHEYYLATNNNRVNLFVDFNQSTVFYMLTKVVKMANPNDKTYINTTVNSDLLKSLRILAATEGKRMNQLLEEAIKDLLKKRDKKPKE